MADFTGEVHPVADLFPMLADDELGDLAEDIAARGLLQPIVLDPEGRLLDGRNRLAACQKAGIEATFITFDGEDPAGYALTVNITRRHLTTGARAVLAEQARRLNGVGKSAQSRETEIERKRLSEAAVVLDWAPALAPAVIAGVTPLSRAVEDAREVKRDAEALQAKLDRLRADADDLAALVDEGRMGVDDAIAALDAREEKARQDADAEAAAEREYEAQLQSERRAAATNLRSVLTYLTSTSIDPDELAERDYGDVLAEFKQADLDYAAVAMQAIAVLKRNS